jgi:hypothetical protein
MFLEQLLDGWFWDGFGVVVGAVLGAVVRAVVGADLGALMVAVLEAILWAIFQSCFESVGFRIKAAFFLYWYIITGFCPYILISILWPSINFNIWTRTILLFWQK